MDSVHDDERPAEIAVTADRSWTMRRDANHKHNAAAAWHVIWLPPSVPNRD